MVFKIFTSILGLVRIRAAKTEVDSWVFKLHYRWTASFCFLSAALVAASDYIGKPISCFGASKIVNTFCWITSTFTINSTSEDGVLYQATGSNFHGLGTFDPKIHEETHHSYYQWVPFVLFLQGVFYYLPHQFWKVIEGKQVNNLLQGLDLFGMDENAEEKIKKIVDYLWLSRGLNQRYFIGYFACECLNFANVITQMILLDVFFGGMFLNYGNEVLAITLEDDSVRHDPMIKRFPRVTKCTFKNYGVSGTIQTHDYICILPQNLLNEKIFLLMWIWFIALAVLTAAKILLQIVIFMSPLLRAQMLERRGRVSSSEGIQHMVSNLPLGDYAILEGIGKNLNALHFRDILLLLTEKSFGSNSLLDLSPSRDPVPFETSTPTSDNRRPTMDSGIRSRPSARNLLYNLNASFENDHGEPGDNTIERKLDRKRMENEE